MRIGWKNTKLRSQEGTEISVNANRTRTDLDRQSHLSLYPQVVGEGVADLWIEVKSSKFNGSEHVSAVFLPDASRGDIYEKIDLQRFGDHYAGKIPTSLSFDKHVDATPFAYDWAPVIGDIGTQLGSKQAVAIEDGRGSDGWEKDPVGNKSNFELDLRRDW